MPADFLEPHARALYRLLGHGDDFSDCRCIDVNIGGSGLIDRTILKGETEFIKWAKEFNGRANCFVGRNPRDAGGAVVQVTTYSYDLDPIREAKTASTVAQLDAAILAGRTILRDGPAGYLASSGNGSLVLYLLDNPTKELKAFERWLAAREDALQRLLSDKGIQVKVDHTHDSARVVKLVGTMSTKGDKSLWRLSRFIDLPSPPYRSVSVAGYEPMWAPPQLGASERAASADVRGDSSADAGRDGQPGKSVGARVIPGSMEIGRARAALGRLAATRCESYDSWLRVGLALRSLESEGLRLWEEWSRKSKKYQEGVCEQKWATFDEKESASTEQLTLASLIYWADQDDPKSRLERDGSISIADLSIETASSIQWLVPGLIAKGAIGFIAGLPKTMKTWMAMDLAIEMARGPGTWLNLFPVSAGRVLYIEQERPKQETTRRFISLCNGKGVNRESLRDSLVLKLGSSIRLDLLPSFAALKTELSRLRPDLLVVDSFATFHTKDESFKSEIQQVLERVKDVRNTVGCAVIFVDHETKQVFNQEDQDIEPNYGTLHGNVAKSAAAEVILTVRRHDACTSAVHNTANTLHAPAERFYVRIRDVENGIVLEGSR